MWSQKMHRRPLRNTLAPSESRARCKAENEERYRGHYWLLQLGSAKKKTLFMSWRSNF